MDYLRHVMIWNRRRREIGRENSYVTSVQLEEKNYLTLKKDFYDGVLSLGHTFGGAYLPVYGTIKFLCIKLQKKNGARGKHKPMCIVKQRCKSLIVTINFSKVHTLTIANFRFC